MLSPFLNQLKYNNESFTFRTHQTEMTDWDKHDRIVQHNCLFKNQLLGSLDSLWTDIDQIQHIFEKSIPIFSYFCV